MFREGSDDVVIGGRKDERDRLIVEEGGDRRGKARHRAVGRPPQADGIASFRNRPRVFDREVAAGDAKRIRHCRP
jgi:hypothetical protein